MPIPPPPAPGNAVILSALDMIASSLRLLGVYSPGEAVPASEANDGLMVLNQMIDGWNADRLAIFTQEIRDFPFVVGKQDYTLGSGGDFDMTRPARITAMSAILLANQDNPVELPIALYTTEQWQTMIPVKVVDSSFPLLCYDDGSYPLRVLRFWPIPQQQNSVRIYSWQPLILAGSLNATIVLPPGYSEAFRYNLAVRLAPEYSVAVPPSVGQVAIESLARLKTMNAPKLTLRSDLLPSTDECNYLESLFGIPYL